MTDRLSLEDGVQEFAVVMSCVSAIVAAFFAFLQNRDKLRYDAKLLLMQVQIDTCQADRSAQQVTIEGLQRKLTEHMLTCVAQKRKP